MTSKPPPLREGDTIAIIAPASAPRDLPRFERGVEQLRSRGYRVEVGRSEYVRRGYLCGPDPDRMNELNGFLQRPDIKMILAARGGYGTLRLLPDLDYAALSAHPKLIVGYSDITALHFAVYERTRIPGISGPMAAVEWHDPDPPSERLFWDLIRGGTPDSLLGPRGERMTALRPGTSQGVLLGGNLSVIVRLIGTPFMPPLEHVILFIEDVGEQPYRIDAMFAQLKLSGLLDKLGGLVIGSFTDSEPDEDSPSLTVDEVLNDYLCDVPYPVAKDLLYGHFPVKNTLPVGVQARLEVTSERVSLAILEPVVNTDA